jgi:murein DD-endopeptidase MepM/ murein hydrolase activator NlpD
MLGGLAVLNLGAGAWFFHHAAEELAAPSRLAELRRAERTLSMELGLMNTVLDRARLELAEHRGTEWQARVVNGLAPSGNAIPASFAEAPPSVSPPSALERMLGLGISSRRASRLWVTAGNVREGLFEASDLSASYAQILRVMEREAPLWKGIPSVSPLEDPAMSSDYGMRRDPFTGRRAYHRGLDFRAPTGTRILATADGIVVKAGWSGGYGRMVEIDHQNGLSTLYAHASRVAVKRGQRVRRGQVVGYVGRTGRASAPHLHYEVRLDGEPMNPRGSIPDDYLAAD